MDARGWGSIIWEAGVPVGQLEQRQSRSASLRLIVRGRTRAAAVVGKFGGAVIEIIVFYHWLISKSGLAMVAIAYLERTVFGADDDYSNR
jgi:hypothetical protein